MDAWSLTDHGQMNGFAHAYLHTEKLNKAGGNFKFIPGCEMYVHPDLDSWRRDLTASKDDKHADERARDAVATPLTAVVDGDDETVDVGSDEAALTIENEEETKSGKFYDPVKRRHHLVVLPKTPEGLERLFHLVSRGYKEGFYRFPRVDYKMLREAAKGGHLLVSTACLGGPLSWEVFKHVQQVEFNDLHASLLDSPGLMSRVLADVGNTYGQLVDAVGEENVYLELQFNRLAAQHLVNRALIEFADRSGLKDRLVVTCDSHYSRPERWKEREIYKKLGWLNFNNYDPSALPQSREDLKCELYPKNASQVWDTYLETSQGHSFYDSELVREAIERTHDVAHNQIGAVKANREMKLPSYVIPEGLSEDKALLEECKKGLVWRGLADREEYIERLKTELRVIKQKTFSRYFLTMKAIMDVAREHMLIGPGRGSAAGSLVAYVLGITNIDPIKYNLLFNRFLSPQREGAPDIDSDIADRDKLIDLLREKFGEENVVPISNYNTFKLKSLVKDVSRFYSIPFDEVNKALAPVEDDVKKAVFTKGTDKNLFTLLYEDALKHSPSFQNFIEEHPEVAEPIEILFKQNKSLGRHAGGVIVSERIEERMPLILARGEAQTPWVEGMHYKHLEEFGWIKFDLLGLETLRIIERTIELILQRREGIKKPTFAQVKDWFDRYMDPSVLDLDDQRVYEHVYHDGRWAGIFQATQRGAQQFFMQGKPRSIIDIATLTSIYRPGPLDAGVHKIYLDSKANPDKIDYQHPLIEKVLKDTYNCIIFQEQTMALCNIVAGFPQEDCDTVRRTIMKRSASKADSMKKQAQELKDRFVEGAVGNGVDRQLADVLYEKVLLFSGYGFNLSHAVSYAIDSYYCAWLLTYYEEEWLCAYLESMSGNPDKRKKAFGEVKKLGYAIVPIDINYATSGWTILEGKRFMPSFNSCKGVGDAAIEEITANRPYQSIDDLLWDEEGKWRHSKFNKKAMEALIKIKAFDSMDLVGPGKMFSSYKAMHDIVIEKNAEIKKWTKKDPDRGRNRFKELTVEMADEPEWSLSTFAGFSREFLGSFNASSLLSPALMKKFESKSVVSIDEYEERDIYWFVVTEVKPKLTKNKKPYLLLNVTGSAGGNTRIFCWGWNGDESAVLPFSVCIAEVEKNDFGCSTKMHRLKMLDG